jgi:hypothetical protein
MTVLDTSARLPRPFSNEGWDQERSQVKDEVRRLATVEVRIVEASSGREWIRKRQDIIYYMMISECVPQLDAEWKRKTDLTVAPSNFLEIQRRRLDSASELTTPHSEIRSSGKPS